MIKKQIIIIATALAIFLLTGAIIFTLVQTKTNNLTTFNNQVFDKAQVTPKPTPTPDPLAPQQILLLGYGGPNHDGGYLSDTIMIASINFRQKQITLISIPRDLWVNLPIAKDPYYSKINAAYAIGLDDKGYPQKPKEYSGTDGGFNLAKTVITQVTGLPINYTVGVDFSGFETIINTLGGVGVYVPFAFDDPYYPLPDKKDDLCGKSEEEVAQIEATLSGELVEQSFSCRFENLHFEQGWQNMDGNTALKYARSRHSPTNGGDFSRALRQQAVLQAVKDKALSLYAIPKIPQLISQFFDFVTTDISLKDVLALVKKQPNLGEYQLKTVALTTDNVLTFGVSNDGQSILMPKDGIDKWQKIHSFIKTELEATDSAALE
ncbi:hypothetical protein GYA49_03175 [Candidatus Beckwithbacteria bacterium]|nr:hypothetical protein [Candidatus Beckwithbacteria bacterium]